MKNTRFKGVIPALVTALTEDETLDVLSQQKLVSTLEGYELNGYAVAATTGEGFALRSGTYGKLISTVRELTARPIIAGVFGMGERQIVDALKDAAYFCVDAALVTWPAYMLPPKNTDQLRDYFIRLADNSTVPLIVYDIPQRLNEASLSLDLLVSLSAHMNIAGAKLSSANGEFNMEVGKTFRDHDFAILIGNQRQALPVLSSGCADGVVASGANFDPILWIDAYNLARNPRATDDELVGLMRRITAHHDLYCSTDCGKVASEVANLKYLLKTRGILCRDRVARPDTEVPR